MNTPHLRNCPKVNCNQKNDCCPFRKIVIPAVMGDDSEDSPSAPENGAYRNALVEYEANGAMYIYASDGIFTKISMVTAEYGAATVAYVDTQDAATLQAAKDYADEHGGGVDDTLRLTVAYGDGNWKDGEMPGVNIDFNLGTASGRLISSRVVPTPTFTDETTNTVYTTQEVYDLLDAGRKIVLDSVPLGWYVLNSGAPTIQLVDGVPLTSKVDYGGGAVAYYGGAVCSAGVIAAVTSFGIRILRHFDSGQNVVYDLTTQGVLEMTSPI